MSFRIVNLEYKKKKIQLCDKYTSENSNIFTLITGKNGVGKTQLLTHIIKYYIDQFDQQKNLITVKDKFNSNIPEKLIVHTNSKFDRFPSMYKMPKQYKNLTASNYYSVNNEIFTSLLNNKNLNKRAIYDTLAYLEYNPIIEYSAILKTSSSGKGYLNETFTFYKDELIKIGFNPNIIPQKQPKTNKNLLSVLNRINENNVKLDLNDIPLIYNLLKNKKIFDHELNFIFDFLEEKVDYGELDKNEYQLLHKYNLIYFRDIYFYKDGEDSLRIDFQFLSSGQQAILNILIGVSSVISNRSLICIDEPEISLHPEWQEEIIEKLQNAFKDIYGCHFLIATHSPQVVSGLKSDNGYILDLENNILHKSIDYSKKSADYQLAKLFNAPGYNNEYIIKICLFLLSKIRDKANFDNNDLSNISELKGFQLSLKNDDPVYYLVKEVISLAEV
ncbi:hypothetical protein D3C78_36780 [compost metagenome]